MKDAKNIYSRNLTAALPELLCKLLLVVVGTCLIAQVPIPSSPRIAYRNAHSVLSLPYDVAAKGGIASLNGTVIFSNPAGIIVHDNTGGIWIGFGVHPTKTYALGDLVSVIGHVEPGEYSPQIMSSNIKVTGHGHLPLPDTVSFEQLSSGKEDAQRVSIDGTIRNVSFLNDQSQVVGVSLTVAVIGGRVDAILPSQFASTAHNLIDADVRIVGTALNRKNDNRQTTGVILAVPDMSGITVLKPGPKDLFGAPLLSIGSLMRYRSNTDYFHRVRLRGVLTYYEPGTRLILQDGTQAIEAFTADSQSLQIGDRIEIVGFPAPESSGPVLEDAVSRCLSHGVPLRPVLIGFKDALSSKYRFSLVSIDMRLLSVIVEPTRTLFLLKDREGFTTAELRSGVTVPTTFAPGSLMRISGINLLRMEGGLNYLDSTVHSDILVRSLDDVSLLRPASWWTQTRLTYLACALGILTLVFLFLLFYSQLKHWRMVAVLRDRKRLAHDIHDTLAQSFAGIGFQLQVIRKAVANGDPNLMHHVEIARNLVQFSHKEARRSLNLQSSDESIHTDLLSALEACSRGLVECAPIKLEIHSSGSVRQLSQPLNTQLFRIGQEAISNAVRHADPTRITINLEYGIEFVRLQVVDNGSGFIIRGDLLGFGIRGMRTRASEINGDLDVQSAPGAGTTVTATVPLPVPRAFFFRPVVFVLNFVRSVLERATYATDKH